ncbi:MAG TPA: chromate transporter [Edaphobacter sp.]|nr:chromate transporter [Edaphobacter sp.]
MDRSPQLATEQKAPFGDFLLYFLRLGTIGFGGPIALASRMQSELVEERGWIEREDYLEGLSFAQLAPGPLAAQLAMYLGYVRGGALGATAVGIAFVAPSFLMVVAISALYVRYDGLKWMQALFYGIGAAVIGIILRSTIKLGRVTLKKDPLLWAIFFVLAISTAYTGREIIWLFLLAGLVSLTVKTRSSRTRSVVFAISPASFLFAVPTGKHWAVFLFFVKSSLFVFGSGLAIVPFLHEGVVESHQWLNERQFLDAIAVAMITPGPVVITVAFIGYLADGLTGAILAGLGVFLPVYLMIVTVAPFYRRFSRNNGIKAFVSGVTAAATGAIAGAVFVLARHSIGDLSTAAIACLTLLVLWRWKVPEPIIVVGSGIAGLLLFSSIGGE